MKLTTIVFLLALIALIVVSVAVAGNVGEYGPSL